MVLFRRINKLIGVGLFPLLVYWVFACYETTPKMGYIYYSYFTGFFNPDGIISASSEGFTMMMAVVVLGVTVPRFFRHLEVIFSQKPKDTARDFSENISNILDLGYIWVTFNLMLGIPHMESPGLAIFAAVALCIGFIPWKVLECSTSTDRDEDGLFDVRRSVREYLKSSKEYNDYKKRLLTDYKRVTS